VNQPHDAIRPRHRRRHRMAATNPAVARAEQSTRVLIRVPVVTGVPPTILRPAAAQSSTTLERGETKQERTQINSAPSGLKALLNDTTAKRPAGSPQPSQVQQQSPRLSPAQPGAKLPSEAAGQHVERTLGGAPTQPVGNPQFRIDAAHIDSTGPHSAAEVWVEKRGGVLSNVLQRRSVLAVALIIAGAVGIAMMLHGRTQHRAIKSETDSGANASRGDLKSDGRFPEAATVPNGSPQSLNGNHAGSGGFSGGMLGGLLTAQQSTGNGGSSNQQQISGPQYGADGVRPANPAAAPDRWKAPAGANMPASIEPIGNIQQPAAGPTSSGIDQGPLYSAYRDTAQPNGSAISGPSGRSSGAAEFDGNINNPSVQFSR
jgi:hypothetical protein